MVQPHTSLGAGESVKKVESLFKVFTVYREEKEMVH